VVATSEKYLLVGIVEGEVLVIYLDRAEDNSPVSTATLEVSLDGQPFKAELQQSTATYEVTAPVLDQPHRRRHQRSAGRHAQGAAKRQGR
jgi:hypothetical protein